MPRGAGFCCFVCLTTCAPRSIMHPPVLLMGTRLLALEVLFWVTHLYPVTPEWGLRSPWFKSWQLVICLKERAAVRSQLAQQYRWAQAKTAETKHTGNLVDWHTSNRWLRRWGGIMFLPLTDNKNFPALRRRKGDLGASWEPQSWITDLRRASSEGCKRCL